MEIVKAYRDAVKVRYRGVELTASLRDGSVGWSADWLGVFDMSRRGLLTVEHLGPACYGGVVYRLPAAELAGLRSLAAAVTA